LVSVSCALCRCLQKDDELYVLPMLRDLYAVTCVLSDATPAPMHVVFIVHHGSLLACMCRRVFHAPFF